MNILLTMKQTAEKFILAFKRFPLTMAFFFLAMIINMFLISTDLAQENWLLIAFVAALAAMVAQVAFERFYEKPKQRLLLYGLSCGFTIVFYFMQLSSSDLHTANYIITLVTLLGLFTSFVWLPTIKDNYSFNRHFMFTFKAFFMASFFAIILILGLMLILQTINQLLFTLPNDTTDHVANVIFVFFAPAYYLALTAEIRPQQVINEQEETTKFLENVLTYVLIPITLIFTAVLLIYIMLNVRSSFWQNDLLEAILVFYIIASLIIYVLSCSYANKICLGFQKIFPKILVIIVIFQTLNSCLKIVYHGLTYGRYYAILFGIFSLLSAFTIIFTAKKEKGFIAKYLIICLVISLMPLIDPFTLSKHSQINILRKTLLKNEMLVEQTIIPKTELSEADEQIIIDSTRYLSNLNYQSEIDFLADDFMFYQDFETTFGFNYNNFKSDRVNYYSYLPSDIPITIIDSATMIPIVVEYDLNNQQLTKEIPFSNHNQDYYLTIENSNLYLNDELLISQAQINDYLSQHKTNKELSLAEATLEFAQGEFKGQLIFTNISVYSSEVELAYSFDAYLIIYRIK